MYKFLPLIINTTQILHCANSSTACFHPTCIIAKYLIDWSKIPCLLVTLLMLCFLCSSFLIQLYIIANDGIGRVMVLNSCLRIEFWRKLPNALYGRRTIIPAVHFCFIQIYLQWCFMLISLWPVHHDRFSTFTAYPENLSSTSSLLSSVLFMDAPANKREFSKKNIGNADVGIFLDYRVSSCIHVC